MRIEGYTDNGIAYNSDTHSSQGAHYTLFPIKEVHSQEDILKARALLRSDFDVTSITIMSYEQDTDETVKYVCNNCKSDKVLTTLKGISVYANDLRIKGVEKKKKQHNFCNSCNKYVKLNKVFTIIFKESYNVS